MFFRTFWRTFFSSSTCSLTPLGRRFKNSSPEKKEKKFENKKKERRNQFMKQHCVVFRMLSSQLEKRRCKQQRNGWKWKESSYNIQYLLGVIWNKVGCKKSKGHIMLHSYCGTTSMLQHVHIIHNTKSYVHVTVRTYLAVEHIRRGEWVSTFLSSSCWPVRHWTHPTHLQYEREGTGRERER